MAHTFRPNAQRQRQRQAELEFQDRPGYTNNFCLKTNNSTNFTKQNIKGKV